MTATRVVHVVGYYFDPATRTLVVLEQHSRRTFWLHMMRQTDQRTKDGVHCYERYTIRLQPQDRLVLDGNGLILGKNGVAVNKRRRP